MNVRRQIKEGIVHQGTDERIAYTLDTAPWGGGPVNPAIAIYSYDPVTETYTDVSLINLFGVPTVLGDIITLPLVIDLVIGTQYRVDMQFDIGGNTLEAYARIYCER
jgi:hypothetical protein